MSEEEKRIIEITKRYFNSTLDVGEKFMLGKIYQIIEKQKREIEKLKQEIKDITSIPNDDIEYDEEGNNL